MPELSVSSTMAAQAFSAGSVPKPTNATDVHSSRKAAEEFESFFVTQMLENMFKGIETDGYFGGGYGEGVYRSMMLQEYGRVLAKSGGIGIADMVSRELINLQETSK
jgi:Rod binding domain-containing protein